MYGNPEIDAVMDKLPGFPWHDYPQRNEIRSCLASIESEGSLPPELGNRVIEIANNFSLLTAERFLENSYELYGDPRFNPDQFYELFVMAHQRFGRLAGGYFSRSYGDMLKTGVNPQDFYNWVDQAAESRGKKFAGWFAYGVPNAVEEGGDPREYLSLASGIHIKGGLKVARSFILESPILLRDVGLTFQQLYGLVTRCIEECSPKTAGLAIHNMNSAAKLGYSPDQFIDDAVTTQRLAKRPSGNAAAGYVSAFNYLYWESNSLEIRLNDARRNFDYFQDPLHEQLIWELEYQQNSFHPHEFKEEYQRLLKEIGQSPASFLSRIIRGDSVNIHELAEKVIAFRGQVKPKIFHAAMYFIPDITNPSDALLYLDDIFEEQELWSDDQIVKALAYTRGAVRRGAFFDGLLHPPEKTTWWENGDLPFNEWPLEEIERRERSIREHALHFYDEERFDYMNDEEFFI